jgi:catechol 2,3-dioxygenase-like lactoylglutathione lyase family enzyme
MTARRTSDPGAIGARPRTWRPVVAGLHEQARALLAEIEQTAGVRETGYYARELPGMLRTALAAGDPALAKRLADALEPRYPLNEHALCAARAQLAEQAGEYADAATVYTEAARRWREFGNAETPLREARELFCSIGYKPALAETETLLGAYVLDPDGNNIEAVCHQPE